MNKIRGFQLFGVLVLLALVLPGAMPVRPTSASPVQPETSFDCSTVTEIPQTECEALVALYNNTGGANWTNNTDWLVTNTPCTWYGVTCAAGSVSSLLLDSNQLSGVIPLEIGNLPQLQQLSLGYNQLSGSIPPEVGNLTMLQGLYLLVNQLSGAIPSELGSLTSLEGLNLGSNQLSETIPPEIGNLAALQWIDLGYNQLSGAIPPEIGDLIALTRLDLNGNQLSGAIPSEIGNLTALSQLYLGNNQLSGTIPPEIGNLATLTNLGLQSNQLSGVIPSEIGDLAALGGLTLANNQLSGAIPPEIGNLVALQSLHLYDNQLSGALPEAMTQLVALNWLYFNNTNLCVPPEGPVPAWLATIPHVVGTGLICGEPLPLCADVVGVSESECEALVALYNATDGANWTNSTDWLVTNTPCDWYGVMCAADSVSSLLLDSNQLSGVIPLEIGNLPQLQQLSLGYNQLSGSIPSEIGNLTMLQDLNLKANQLSGAIPWDIGNLAALQDLDLSSNQLGWDIPTTITNLIALSSDGGVDLGYNKLASSDPTVIAFLNTKDSDWVTTQTVPPTNLTASPSNYSVLLTWTPITYTADGGYYEVSWAEPIFGTPVGSSTTVDKGSHSYLVEGLYASPYIFHVRTYTPAHGDQQNALWSEYTSWVRATPSQLEPGFISGYILKADGSTVITDTQISVHAHGITPNSSSLGTYVSQADGSYTISGLAPGTYKVQANNNRAPGYVSKYYDNKYSWDSADTIEVVAGQTTSGINFALEPGGTIRGTVLKEGGGVITDVQLYVGAGTETGIWVSTPISQIDGSYELLSLPDGAYRVEANFHTLGYDRKYYNNVYRWDQATLVTIAGGNTVSNIDFALGPGGGLTGHVYAQDGVTPIEGVCVNVSSTAPDFNQVVGWGRTGPDGSFSFGGVPVGNIYIQTHASCGGGNLGYLDEWYADGGSVIDGNAATPVQIVVGQYTSAINFTLDPAGSISGSIYNADGSSLLSNVMYGFESTTQQGSYTTWCTGDGIFAKSLAFGSYKVFAQGNSEHCGGDPNYKREYWQEKDNWVLADIITLTPESPNVTGLIFTLEPGGAISGTVYQADGITPIPNAWVYAMDSQFQYVAGSHAQADGRYLIGGLSQGSYYLAVQAEGFGGVYYPNGHDDPGAVLVPIIVPATTPNINFTLAPEATLSGFVFESDGVTPISAARVSVWPRAGGQIRSAYASSTGAYTVHGLSTGSYVAKAEANGFETEYYLNAYDWSAATAIPVTQPNTTSGILFTLSLPASPPPLIEKQALEALYNSTNGSQWLNRNGWMVDPNACTWYGVTCFDGHITRLSLVGNQLSGAIAPEIGNLTALQYLDLHNNQLTGAVPPQIGNLTTLWYLSLGSNQLSGAIPPQVGNLTALIVLSLPSNQLSGAIPPQIGNLTALQSLGLDNNQLSGAIPPQIGNLTALQSFNLGYNQLSGVIPPEIGNLTALTVLYLYNNQLSGAIPPEIGNLTALTRLWLDVNQLNGAIPPGIGNLTALTSLDLYDNQLSGAIPPQIGNLTALQYLNFCNNQLSGAIPPQIGNLTALQRLSLYNNQLSGAIPPEIGSLAALRYLYLHNNPLSGEVPTMLTPLTLINFTFYDTDWCVPPTGAVPAWLSTIPILYGTGLICGAAPGSLSGAVTLPDTTPASGVQVDLYRSSPEWPSYSIYLTTTHTTATGAYQFTDLGQGLGIDYRVRFVDPTGQLAPQYYNAKPTIATATVITITPGIPRTGIDAILAIPQPPAAGVETESGSVVFNPDGTAQITMPRPNLSDITVTRTVTCAVGTPTTVTLLLSTGPQFPMANVGGDAYRATLPAAALTANATLRVRATCGATTTETVIGYVTLYDPSGIVSDVRNSQPIAGATVTLYQVPGWEPKTGPTDNRPNTCESNLSKPAGTPWNQPAPTELGIVVNPEVTVTAPKIPYQQTTAAGYYGWDVPQGCWYVTVTAEGYEPFTSPVVGIPPAVVDLDLALTPLGGVDFKVFLPLVLRQQ